MQKLFLLLALVSLSFASSISMAKEELTNVAKEQAKGEVVAESEIDQGLKNFGYISGLALSCVAKAQKVELENEVLNLNGDITRTLGADRAFLFAASFGYGTNIELNREECKEILATYEQRVAAFKQGLGEK
ncbi:hypothetical protein [Thalassotalea aquiviva]|uniref:hypothetical protein n=1 Tax=Thalassotalea aquiviva TaxID=3242415 RepID=UPI00352BBC1B